MEFSIPTPPTGAALSGYRNTGNVYFAAVEEVDENGARIAGAPVKFYPVQLSGTTLTFEIPMAMYLNGAGIVLCQGIDVFGEINFSAPLEIIYNASTASYIIPYNEVYEFPDGLIDELTTNGDNSGNTDITLYIQPDSRVDISGEDFTINSDVFEIAGTPYWNNVTHELEVTLKLKSGWETADNLETTFTFSGEMSAVDFTEGEILVLTGNIVLEGLNSNNTYYIPGNITRTDMIIRHGNITVSNTTTGDDADQDKYFNFRVDFSDGGTYDGITSGHTFSLKHDEEFIINNIINGVVCTIIQTDNNTDGYTTTVNGSTDREVIGEETLEFAFNNHKDITSEPDEPEDDNGPVTGDIMVSMIWFILMISSLFTVLSLRNKRFRIR